MPLENLNVIPRSVNYRTVKTTLTRTETVREQVTQHRQRS